MPLTAADRFEALKAGKIDLLSRNSTWTMGRETGLGLTFVGVTYYDGQGFLVPRAANVMSALELTGSKVCVQSGTTTEANLADYFAANNMTYEAVVTGVARRVDRRLQGRPLRRAHQRHVAALRASGSSSTEPDEHIILPDAISKEPLGPAVRRTIRNGRRW